MEGHTRWPDDRLDDLAKRVDRLEPLATAVTRLETKVDGITAGQAEIHEDFKKMNKQLERVAFEEPLSRARAIKQTILASTFAACAGAVLTFIAVSLASGGVH